MGEGHQGSQHQSRVEALKKRFNHRVCHELTLAHRESKWNTFFKPLIFGRVCHSRMLLAGIQAEFGLDPRLKHSGGDDLGTRISSPQRQFSKEVTKITMLRKCALPSLPSGRALESSLRGSLHPSVVIPGKLAIASTTRNPGKSKCSGYPLSRV